MVDVDCVTVYHLISIPHLLPDPTKLKNKTRRQLLQPNRDTKDTDLDAGQETPSVNDGSDSGKLTAYVMYLKLTISVSIWLAQWFCGKCLPWVGKVVILINERVIPKTLRWYPISPRMVLHNKSWKHRHYLRYSICWKSLWHASVPVQGLTCTSRCLMLWKQVIASCPVCLYLNCFDCHCKASTAATLRLYRKLVRCREQMWHWDANLYLVFSTVNVNTLFINRQWLQAGAGQTSSNTPRAMEETQTQPRGCRPSAWPWVRGQESLHPSLFIQRRGQDPDVFEWISMLQRPSACEWPM